MFQSVPTAPGELQISEKMANAITGWLLAFYQRPAWLEAGYRVTNAPINVTDYMSTLACNEIAMSAGASARGTRSRSSRQAPRSIRYFSSCRSRTPEESIQI